MAAPSCRRRRTSIPLAHDGLGKQGRDRGAVGCGVVGLELATVTPSLIDRGAPKDLSRMTLQPLGASVILTALARMSTPRIIRSRASAEKLTSFAAILLFSVEFYRLWVGECFSRECP